MYCPSCRRLNRLDAYFCAFCPAPIRCRNCNILCKTTYNNTFRRYCGSCSKPIQRRQRNLPAKIPPKALQQFAGQLSPNQPIPLPNLLLELEGREIVLRQTWDVDDIVLAKQEIETLKSILASYTNRYHITVTDQQWIQTLFHNLGGLERNLISRGNSITQQGNWFNLKLDRLDSYTKYIKNLAIFESISTLERLAEENMTVLESLSREAALSTSSCPLEVRKVIQRSLDRLLAVDEIIRQRQIQEDVKKRQNWGGVLRKLSDAVSLASSLIGLGTLIKKFA